MFKKFSAFLILFFTFFNPASAQKGKYNIANISPALLKNAVSIKRDDIHEFEIKDIGKAKYKVITATTLLNETAKNSLVFAQYVDKFKSLEEVSIELFDAKGNTLKKYSKSDLIKQATGEGLVPDGKLYYLQVPVSSYPVTVKFEYEIKYKGLSHYPIFEIQTPGESVENAIYSTIVPVTLDLRYKVKNISTVADTSNNNGTKLYQWKLNNLTSFNYEAGAVNRRSRYPQIILAPNKFELDDYDGDMSSWQNFGNWYGNLSKAANNLSNETKIALQKIASPYSNEKQKIEAIYKNLQNNFRYVSIQLGIGGFKPFDANFVDTKKYGDCKALSNYMQACLASVGVKSYQALINAGYNEEAVDVNFPANQFNHVILCVPLQKDTIWLECTSNTNDFGVLGSFTENRKALLITEHGGILVSTPNSNAQDNSYNTITNINLQENGSSTATYNIQVKGEYKQNFIHHFLNQKNDEQKKYLIEELNYMEPSALIVTNNKAENITIEAEFEKTYDFAAGKKMFINPRLHKLWNTILPNSENRKLDYYFHHPFIITDTTNYIIPSNLSIETLPKSKSITNEFASYLTTYRYLENERKIISSATLILRQNKIPASNYNTIKQFFDEVIAEYNEKIILKKQ